MKTTPLFLIVGRSGTGKDTLASYLEKFYGLKNALTYTTRPMRTENEKTHHFVDRHTFHKIKNKLAVREFKVNDKLEFYCTTLDLTGCRSCHHRHNRRKGVIRGRASLPPRDACLCHGRQKKKIECSR